MSYLEVSNASRGWHQSWLRAQALTRSYQVASLIRESLLGARFYYSSNAVDYHFERTANRLAFARWYCLMRGGKTVRVRQIGSQPTQRSRWFWVGFSRRSPSLGMLKFVEKSGGRLCDEVSRRD